MGGPKSAHFGFTGLYGLYFELDGKRLEILKEALPGVSRIAVFWGAGFGLAVNLKIAKALGITIPESILLRADEVIR